MEKLEGLRAEISGLRVSITGGMKPEDGIQYRIRELERDIELRKLQEKATVKATEKKTDRSYLVWAPVVVLLVERAWSYFTGKHN